MESQSLESSSDQVIEDLKACASSLVEQLQNNDYHQASAVISQLNQSRDSLVFNSVGRLTRALHSSIVNFSVQDGSSSTQESGDRSHMSDASDRLEYVLRLTQEAADKTMDKVEECAPIASDLRDESKALRDEWSRLKRREMDVEEFSDLYYRMDHFLAKIEGGSKRLNQNLQEIILEQGYQDLTGQVLKKVMGMVADVETELVNLVRIAGQVEEVAGFDSSADIHKDKKQTSNGGAEGPQINVEKRDDVVSGQDEVDDLLSSLGF